MGDFSWPFFYTYPPYFTLQPVKETRQKQSALWIELILKYCRHHKVYQLTTDPSDDSPLFSNQSINRRLTQEGRSTFLTELVARGNGLWLDNNQRTCLVLWHTAEQWADIVYEWARSLGLEGSVTTVDELSTGDEVQGTELAGMPRAVLMEALKVLERRGKARIFKGAAADDDGVKFFK
ncbi:hypothetical protein WJX73_007654 [Symbiochloris irregularis]|uniref:ESCRT-II complex subunit VPS25 n=1 Tax=Symbiochloris irregularis TaxID=706552 RepID=A0AAW1NNQ7_9CHLO